MNAKEIISQFNSDHTLIPYGNGHINDTFVTNNLIIQRINTDIFSNPDHLMENIINITEFLSKKITAAGGDPERETLTVVPTLSGKSYYKAQDGSCYRAYSFIEDSVSYDIVSAPLLYRAAKAFGKFQNMLSDYPANTLHEIIPKFHDTYNRFCNLVNAAEKDVCGRLESVRAEFEFAMAHEEDTKIVLDGIKNGEIPLRVTHNDTKLNNVLFDKLTDDGICVIDLDTVMPGSILYDYGDALRFGGASGVEDEKNLDKIYFELDKFKSFTKGFLEEVGTKLTPREIELLPFSAKLLSLECGMRFLTDYLEGDNYFKTHYEGQNLDRTRTQFKLVVDIEKKMPEMTAIVEKYISKYTSK